MRHLIDFGRGAARAEDAQVTPTQSHISPSTLKFTKTKVAGHPKGAGLTTREGELRKPPRGKRGCESERVHIQYMQAPSAAERGGDDLNRFKDLHLENAKSESRPGPGMCVPNRSTAHDRCMHYMID